MFCTNVNAQITIDGNTNDWASTLNAQPLKVFVRDANDTNDDSFTQGSSDVGLISAWKWSNGQTNNKGDISNAAAVMVGNKIYFAGDRTAINGSAQIGFWFFKRGVGKGIEPDFVGVHEIGDLLVLSNFTNGGGVSELRIYRWVGSGGSDNQLDLIATTFDGFVNQTYQPTPVYPSWTYQGNNVPSVGVPPPNTYATGSFFEGSIDLTQFGLDPCFSSFLLETRNSPSITAALQDFAGGKFNSMPDPPTVTNAGRCGPGAITLSANCTTGNGVRWYSAATGGNPLTAADGVSANGTSLTVNITSNVTYYVACVGSGAQCESERVPVTGTIKSPPTVTLSGGPILCHGGTATITATVTGGSGNYSYAWTKDNNPFNNPGGGNVIQNAGPGMYSVVITDTTQGCTSGQSNNVTLSDPAEIILNITPGNILCHGGVATLTANASGGTGSYTYLWSNGATTQSIQAGAGSYSVSVTDANSCSKSASITLTEPEQLAVNIGNTPILCHGGMSTLTANASGGTVSYTYLWSNGETTPSIQAGAGSYSVSVTDANSCSASASVTVSEPEQLAVNIGNTSVLCHGGMSTLTANVSGGTGSYTYLWSNGATTPSIQAGAGSYSVSVTDANSCSASASITVSEPEQLAVNIGNTPILCHGGTASVSANVTGGTPPYSYLWSNGAATQTVNLPIGNFSVTVKDSNGCTISKNVEVKMLACSGFTTVTQGGWGAKAAGNNWGTYRDLNFAAAFPSGLTIGAGSRFLKLTTAKAVDDFLPSGTTPRMLNAGTLVNPGSSYKNVLAGQVVALTLNLRFDQVNPSFSSSATWLGDLIVVSGPFAGWTVNQVLAEANNVLGGVASSYSADQMNAIVDAINNNCDNGTANLGLLGCPCSSTVKPLAKNLGDGEVMIKNPNASVNDDSKVYPNPTRGDINLTFENAEGGNVSAYLFNSNGRMAADLSKNVSRHGSRVTISYQNYSLLEGVYILTVKASKFEKSYKIIIRK